MYPQIRISHTIRELLRCPICHAKLKYMGINLECKNSECATHFPIEDGIPVLINEQSSVFSIEDFISHRKTFFANINENKLKKYVRYLIPKISNNIQRLPVRSLHGSLRM